jgi:hypothetical protein
VLALLLISQLLNFATIKASSELVLIDPRIKDKAVETKVES